MGNIQARQVQQREGSHSKTTLIHHDAVNGGRVGHALTQNAQCFGAKSAPGVIDQKARGIGGLGGKVAHGGAQGVDPLGNGVGGT